MNLFEVQERLKDFSKSQLVNEMQRPSGMAPQYLVLSELQRRGRMEKAFAAEQAKQGSQSTVAQDAVNAAGMPQGGLAQMAQAMAPRTDMNQNTGVAPVQGMAEGGEVRRMGVGGLADITPNLKAYGVDEFLADPRVREAALRSEMTPYEYLQMLNEDQLNYLRNTPVEDSYARLRDEALFDAAEFDAGRYDGPGGAYSVTERSGVPGRARLSQAGLTGVDPVETVSADDIMAMANANRRDDSADAFSVIGAGIAGPYTEFVERMAETPLFPERRGMQFGETPIGAIQSERAAMPVSGNISVGSIPVRFDAPSASGFVGTDLADDARARRTAAYVEENLARDAAGLPERERVGMSDRTMAAQMDSPFDVDVTAEDVLAGVNAMYPDQRMSDNELANLELQGFDDTDQSGAPGYGFGDMARGIFGDAAIDEIIRNREIGRERERTRALAGQFEAEAAAADAETAALDRATPAPSAPSGAGGAGGTGGGGRGRGTDGDRMLEQDKWLALAQFGLGLMSSQAPTIGQAIGESGIAALGQLQKARAAAVERDLAERTLAARSAVRPDRLSLSDRLRFITDQMETIRAQMAVAVDAGTRLDLSNELASLQQQAADIMGTAGPNTARAAGSFNIAEE